MRGKRPVPWILAAAALLVAGCGEPPYVAPDKLASKLVPTSLGKLEFKREKLTEQNFRKPAGNSLVKDGQVFTLRHDEVVEGSFQVALFKPQYNAQSPDVFYGIQRTIAEGTFQPRTIHGERVWAMKLLDQTIYLWFPPKQNTECLLIVRSAFRQSDKLARALVEYQQGRVPVDVPLPSPQVVTVAAGPSPSPAVEGPLAQPSPSPSGR
jgi:hypothetical protein